MFLPSSIRNIKILRKPLLLLAHWVLSQMRSGPAVIRRALYDAMPSPYVISSHAEHFVVSTADKVIGREIFLHGEFDFAKLVAALDILRREGCPAPCHLIDVGANIGTITIPAINRGLIESATAIEPHPDNLRLLHANAALNGVLDKVRVVPCAVSSETGGGCYLRSLFIVVAITPSDLAVSRLVRFAWMTSIFRKTVCFGWTLKATKVTLSWVELSYWR